MSAMRIAPGQRMDQRMDQRMEQRLDPRLIQSMEFLQLSGPALEARLAAEAADNPALELDSPAGPEPEWQWDDGRRRASERSAGPRRMAARGDTDPKLEAMANAEDRGASMLEHCLQQWHLADEAPADRLLGDWLLSRLDADGYLRESPEQLLAAAPPHTTPEQLERMIPRLQKVLDPPGLAARNLRECLLLQMDAAGADGPEDRLARQIVEHHLPEVEAGRLERLAGRLQVRPAEIIAAIKRLRRFHPHPGRLLGSAPVPPIIPDAVVEKDDAGRWQVRLLRGSLPTITVSGDYEQMSRDPAAGGEARKLATRYVHDARAIAEAVEQRRRTLLRVIEAVVARQGGFLEHGPAAQKPLTETEVAERLGLHVATVSRAVADKHLDTPRGFVALREFFSGGLPSGGGESLAFRAVQERLRKLIEAEDKAKPLSDEALVAVMAKEGIDIARRTVAKYRTEMGIPTARERKAR